MSTSVDISEAEVKRAKAVLYVCGQSQWSQGNDATSDELKRCEQLLGALRSALTACERECGIHATNVVMLKQALEIVFSDDSGDLDFIKFKIRQNLPGVTL